MASRSNWHHEDVKAAVRKRGTTLKEIAISAGLHPSALGHALYRPIPAANHAIAAFLGVTAQEIWPQWFAADGAVRADWRDSITPLPGLKRQKTAAA